jgi:hypothetical protein
VVCQDSAHWRGFCLRQSLNPPEALFSARTKKGEGCVILALEILWAVAALSKFPWVLPGGKILAR